jgi:hypothetical protein
MLFGASVAVLAQTSHPDNVLRMSRARRERKLLPLDAEQAAKLILSAADKKYGPALHEIGKMHIEIGTTGRRPELCTRVSESPKRGRKQTGAH